jgi:general secretion pathway protein G
MKRKRNRSQAGVTLIEMLVVVAIIGLFVALVAPGLWRKVDTSRVIAAKQQIVNFQTALGSYKLDTGTFPTNEQGLLALRVKPADVATWNGPYMPKDIPKTRGATITRTAIRVSTAMSLTSSATGSTASRAVKG